VEVTKAAERTITNDLEYLIEKAVDIKKADYAVFTGVQIHNWASDLNDSSIPSLEFVSVGKSYVMVNGEKTYLDLHQVGRGVKAWTCNSKIAALSEQGSAESLCTTLRSRGAGCVVGANHFACGTG
jgi:hypothetical protein